MKLKKMYEIVKKRLKEYIISSYHTEECFMDLSQSRSKIKELKNTIGMLRNLLEIVNNPSRKTSIFTYEKYFYDFRNRDG